MAIIGVVCYVCNRCFCDNRHNKDAFVHVIEVTSYIMMVAYIEGGCYGGGVL